MRLRFVVFAVALAAMAGVARAQTGEVRITDAWARATPAGATTAAAYLTLTAPTADRLVSVSTPAARQSDLHTMTIDNGVMKMRALPGGVELPAGQAVTLKPGGIHIMLSALTGPLKEGDKIPLTLQFAKSGTREIAVPVEKAGSMGPAGGGMKMPMGH
ncbi:MAG TPA: copper chaperone PCu(A)C [Stellaceae bacterium]|nr:copper chaperone PCu(A)C [Stellaceae bacterium]